MIVFGGVFQNGSITNDMINFDLEYNDWSRMIIKNNLDPVTQQEACTVQLAKKKDIHDISRMSDAILEGIYYFGGKNAKGELQNKLKLLKPQMSEGKISTVEWQKVKQ